MAGKPPKKDTEILFDTTSVAGETGGEAPDQTILDVHGGSFELAKPEEHELLLSPQLETEKAEMSSCTISLLKTILGAGMLAMPAAIASVGWVLGILLVLISAGLSLLGLIMLTKCCDRLGSGSSISSIAKVTYPETCKLIDFALAMKCFGVAISYLIVIGDMMPTILLATNTESRLLLSRNFWILSSAFVVGPLAFLKNLDSLKYTSLAGLLAVVYMVFISITNYFSNSDLVLPPGSEPKPFESLSFAALKNVSIFIFAFTAHQNICTIKGEASPIVSMKMVIHLSIWLSALAYLIFSVTCYATYGKLTMSNAFLNFPAFRIEMVIGRLFYALLSAFSYPLLTHPCRSSIINLIPLDEPTKLRHADKIHQTTTVLIVVGSVISALMIRDLGFISALIGTFIGIPICYIVPGLFYSKLFVHSPSKMTIAAKGLTVFGAFLIIISTISLLK